MGWGDAPRVDGWEADLRYVDRILARKRIQIDAFYSSALGRARDTALYYAEKRGQDLVRSTPELNEVNYGRFVELSKQRVAEICPAYKTDADYIFPEGESFRQMQRRSVGYIQSLQTTHKHDNLLVVAHAGVIRGLVSHFLGLNLEANLKRKVSHRYIGDLRIEADICEYYDELGRPSGFVKDGVIEVPWQRAGVHATSSGQAHLAAGETRLPAVAALPLSAAC